jgi:hypothetical protein
MTAINPARLKIQCADLSETFSDPDRFTIKLHDLLNFYAVRIRQTTISRRSLLLQSYQTPPPVLRAIERELIEPLNKKPSQGLLLIDRLWEEEWLEIQSLAVILLGNLPPINPEGIFKRINAWLASNPSVIIRDILATKGLNRLTTTKPNLVLEFFQNLMKTANKDECRMVLAGLIPFVEDPAFDNLPLIYGFIDQILLIEETGLNKEILNLLKILVKRSEKETVFFLERQLVTASKPRIFRIIRQLLPNLSGSSHSDLRNALDSYE